MMGKKTPEIQGKKKRKPTNPHGYNQSKPDPRQALFLNKYLNPKSPTFANAYQSAIAVGYDEGYAKQITAKGQTWLRENVRTEYIVRRAEKNLQEFLEPEFEDQKIRADMTKFSLERLNKGKYSTRQELTGADGERIIPIFGGKSKDIDINKEKKTPLIEDKSDDI